MSSLNIEKHKRLIDEQPFLKAEEELVPAEEQTVGRHTLFIKMKL